MADHTYYLAEEKAREREPSPSKKRKLEETKRRRDRRRQKTRVNIGVAFQRWRSLMRDRSLQSDAGVACFLLDTYERCLKTLNALKRKSVRVAAPAVFSDAASNGTDSLHDTSSEEDMKENVFNDPLNSVIDWADKDSPSSFEQNDDGEKDGSSEDYIPPICIRMGGALKKAPSINQLPVIGIEETVHDEPAHEEEDPPPPPPVEPAACDQAPGFLSEEDIIGAKASIVYEDCLGQLATFLILPVDKCPGRLKTGAVCSCVAPFEISVTSKGTAMRVEWICPRGHVVWRWSSQPVMKSGMQAGDFLLSANILLSGCSYAKVALLFKFMNLGMVNKKMFCSVQDAFCVDAVKDFWEETRTEALCRLQGKDVVVIAGGRHDSPRLCAQYCSYAAMESDTKDIIHVATIDKQQTSGSSVLMETEGFIETVEKLTSAVKLVEICTDAHAQIEALMSRYKACGIHHSVDVWHGAKNLAKKIATAAKKGGWSVLLSWLKDIVDHFWWCCKMANTAEQFLAEWAGILRHVCDVHTWTTGRCQHGPLEEEAAPGHEWILRDSECHKALTDIVLDPCWQEDAHKYLCCRSTAALETFHNHVLMYASEHHVFSHPVYEARVLLAALDYNFHHNRPTVKTAEGKETFRRLYKKNVRRFGVYALKAEKSYRYIPELQARIVERTFPGGVGRIRRRSRRPEDSRGLRLAPPTPALPAISERMETPPVRERIIVQQVLVIKTEEDPEKPDIKEEQDKLWTNQEGQQADSHMLTFAGVHVKTEAEEEPNPPVGCGGSAADRNSEPDVDVKPDPDSSETELSNDYWQEHFSDSESETEDSDGWK